MYEKRWQWQVFLLTLMLIYTAENVVFIIRVGYQQQYSVRHLLVKESGKGFGLVIHPSEAFLLYVNSSSLIYTLSDIRDEDVRVSISLHSFGPRSGGIARKPSFMIFGQSKKNEMPSRNSNDSHSFVPTQNSLGPVLGELSFNLSQQQRMGKSTGTYTLLANGKKEVAKIILQTGIFEDEEYVHTAIAKKVEPSLPQVPKFSEYLNVSNVHNGVSLLLCMRGINQVDLEKILGDLP